MEGSAPNPSKNKRALAILERASAPLPAWAKLGSRVLAPVGGKGTTMKRASLSPVVAPSARDGATSTTSHVASKEAPPSSSLPAQSPAWLELLSPLVGVEAAQALGRQVGLLTVNSASSAPSDDTEHAQAVPGFLLVDESALPLWVFDTDDDDSANANGNSSGAGAIAGASRLSLPPIGTTVLSPYFIDRRWDWLPAIVRSVDASAGQCTVEFTLAAVASAAGKQKTVRPLDVCVSHGTADGRLAFARRVCTALARREAAKAIIRQQYFIDSAPFPAGSEVSSLSDDALAGIYRRLMSYRSGYLHRRCEVSLASLRDTMRKRQEAVSAALEAQANETGNRVVPMGVSRKKPAPSTAGGQQQRQSSERATNRRTSVFDSGSVVATSGGKAATSTRRTKGRTDAGADGGFRYDDSDDDSDIEDDHGGTIARGNLAAAGGIIPSAASLLSGTQKLTAADALEHARSDPGLASLFSEAVFDYEFAGKKAVVMHAVGQNRSNSAGSGSADAIGRAGLRVKPEVQSPEVAAFIGSICKRYAQLRLPPAPAAASVPSLGAVLVPYASPSVYPSARTAVGAAPYLQNQTVIKLLRSVSRLWQAEWEGSAVFDSTLQGLPLPCSLADWRAHQKAFARTISDRLSGAWHRDVINFLVDGIPHPEFNIYEQDWVAYGGSDLERLLRRVELTMQGNLRDIVGRTCGQLKGFVSRYLPPAQLPPGETTGKASPSWTASSPPFNIRLELRRHKAEGASLAALASASGIASASPSGGETSAALVSSSGAATATTASPAVMYRVHLDPPPSDIESLLGYTLSVLGPAVKAVGGVQKKVCSLLPAAGAPSSPDAPLLDLGRNSTSASDADGLISSTRDWLHDAVQGPLLERPLALAAKLDAHAWIVGEDAGHMLEAALTSAVEVASAKYAVALASYEATHKPQAASVNTTDATTIASVSSAAARPKSGVSPSSSAAPSHQPLRLVPSSPDYRALGERAKVFHDAASFLQTSAADVEDCGLFRVHTADLRHLLTSKAIELRNALLARTLQCARTEADAVHQAYGRLLEQVCQRPRNEAEWLATKAFLAGSSDQLAGLAAATATVFSSLDVCAQFSYPVPADVFNHLWELKRWPLRLHAAIVEGADVLAADRHRMMEELEAEKKAFDAQLESLEGRATAYKDSAVPEGASSLAAELTRIVTAGSEVDNDVRSAQERADDINSREKCFGLPSTNYASIKVLHDGLGPFLRLWASLSDFLAKKETWETSPLQELDQVGIEADVTEWFSLAYKLSKTFGEAYPGAASAARQLRSFTEDFRQHIPLIRHVASRALEYRHWTAINDLMGRSVDPGEEEVTLSQLLAWGAAAKADGIEEVAVQAEKEHALKKGLEGMKKEWAEVALEVVPYKNTNTFVLRGTDEVNTLLDDHITKTQVSEVRHLSFSQPLPRHMLISLKRNIRNETLPSLWLNRT